MSGLPASEPFLYILYVKTLHVVQTKVMSVVQQMFTEGQ